MKKIFTIALYCLFLALLAEFGIGWLGYRFTQGRSYSYDELKQERLEIITDGDVPERAAAEIDQKQTRKKKRRRTEILHPYLGFVVDFHDEECPRIGFCDDRIRSYTNLLQGRDFPEPAPGRAVVVITGGSVAYGIANNSSAGKLERALATIPELNGKEILVYTLALGGYKQPQQLFAIQYYLATGARFDMIINIDGFNEIALPLTENIPFGTNPFFPRVWHGRVKQGSEDRKKKAVEGMKAYFGQQRAILAESLNRSLLRRSVLRNLIWKFQDSALTQKIAKAELDYLNLNSSKGNPADTSRLVTAGTRFPRDDRQAALERLAEFWRRSSEQMHTVANANHIRYYHFLQPNQYVENSKPMSGEERKAAFLEGASKVHPYANAARSGYPYLIAQGALLKRSGVPFHDLTMMFKDNSEVLYRDACCHFNEKGYDLIIDEIVRWIKEDSSQQSNSNQQN